jgi:hypothetical protein
VTIDFGDCTFDPEARELLRAARRVDLAPKALELLQALLEARPRALSKAELRDRLWPDTFVSDTSRAVLEDLGSKNGTFLNGRRVEGSVRLTEADRIVVGREVLVLRQGPSPGTTETDLG